MKYLLVLSKQCSSFLYNVAFLIVSVMLQGAVSLPAPCNSENPPVQWEHFCPGYWTHCYWLNLTPTHKTTIYVFIYIDFGKLG